MSDKAHLLTVVITGVALLMILRLLRRRQLRAKYSLVWLSVGLILVILASSPALLDRVSEWVGITYGPATFFLGAIALLFLIVVQFSWELSRLEERTRTLAEEVALLRMQVSTSMRSSDPPDALGGVGGPEPVDDDASAQVTSKDMLS